MRIPLDYYRILGLPIQATAEQLHQAHRDRALQLPRREFSEAAIASRKQLLDEAYAVLSDPQDRRAYDATFLNRGFDTDVVPSVETDADAPASLAAEAADPYSPSIEIQDSQFVGALLILLELGEYELVLKLGQPLLTPGNLSLNSGRFGPPDIVRSDIVLIVALAHLELGREQWQQGQYESAAASLEQGQDYLLREGLFASVRGEIQSDLYKLRPYRILELIALPESNVAERRQGLSLLQDMLHDRGGIDGTGDDQSGLNVDDFLRFVQQLRTYLTAAEQHTLFEAEARRPSAVATYLAVYAMLARGFAYRQPALIRRAKSMLLKLGSRQDVHLEQAVCALLLGQTEEASRALELSQEYESLAFIRENSQGSPDLLPGLCLYSERWLQNEVFPHFRDLAQQQASLKQYFADSEVQAYLEELPNESGAAEQWTTDRSGADYAIASRRNGMAGVALQGASQMEGQASRSAAATMTVASTGGGDEDAFMPTAERISQLSPEGRLNGGGRFRSGFPKSGGSVESDRSVAATQAATSAASPSRSQGGRRTPRLDRLMFLLAMGALGLLMLWILGSWLARAFNAGPKLTGEQLAISVNEPPLEIPDPNATPAAADPNAPLTNEAAQAIVQGWLTAKTAAFGSNYDTSQLSQVLAGDFLASRQADAESLKSSGEYRALEHSNLQIVSVQTNTTDPNQAEVEAVVTEKTTVMRNGDAVGAPSEERLRLRYSLIRQDGQWRIQGSTLLGEEDPAAATTPETPAATSDEPTSNDTAPESPGSAAPISPEAGATPAPPTTPANP